MYVVCLVIMMGDELCEWMCAVTEWYTCEVVEHVVEEVVKYFSDLWWDYGDLYFGHGFIIIVSDLLNSYITSRRSVIVRFFNED